MRKAASILVGLLLVMILVAPALAATHVAVVNVPEGVATIDGIISPGEWDKATEISLPFTATLAAGNVDGAGIVGGTPPADHTDKDVTVGVRFKIKNGFLYVLETRTDSSLVFTRDNAAAPYASDGSIVFFCKKGESLNTSDLFIMARGRTITAPIFEVRINNGASQGPITAAAAKTVTTANTFVMEAKINIADLDTVTEADFKSGDLLVTYCAVNIIDLDFDGETSGLWGVNYQLQYKGVGPWDESPAIKVVADK